MKARGPAATVVRFVALAAGLLLLLAVPRAGRGQTANVLAVLPEGVVLPAAPFAELKPGSRFGFRRADGSTELVGEGWVLDVRDGRALVALRPGGVVQPGDVAVLCATLSGAGPDAEFRASLEAIKTQLASAGGGTPEVQATLAELDAALAARGTAIRDGACDVAAHDQQIAELSLQLQRALAAVQASPAAPPTGEGSAAGEAETAAQGVAAPTSEAESEASAGSTPAPSPPTSGMDTTIAAALQLVQQGVQIAQSAGLVRGGAASAAPPPAPLPAEDGGGLTQTLLPTTPGSDVEAPVLASPGAVTSPPPSGLPPSGATPPPPGSSSPTGPPLAGGSGSSPGGSPAAGTGSPVAGGGPPASGAPPSGAGGPPTSSRPPGLIRPPVSAPSWTRIPLKPAPAPGTPSTSGGDVPSAGSGSPSFRPPTVALTPRVGTLPESGGTTMPGTGASPPPQGGVTASPRPLPPIALTPRPGLVPAPGATLPGSAGAGSTAATAKSPASSPDDQPTSTVKPVTPAPLLPGTPHLPPGSVRAPGGALTARVAPAPDGAATVRGTVRNADGTPLAGAVVLVGGRRASTNAKGLFLVDDVPAGRQMLVVTAPGFARRTLAMELSVGRVEEVTLTLPRAPLPRGSQ